MNRSRAIVLCILVAVVVLGGLAFCLWDYRHLATLENMQSALGWVGERGALPFFALMAAAPMLGLPVSPFLLAAVPLFGFGVGLTGVVCAMSVNLVLSWLLSAKCFRPFFERLLRKAGYEIPSFSAGDMMGIAFALRITPGVPLVFQNYALGVAQMPLGPYLLVSLPTVLFLSISIVLFGDALFKGSVAAILLAVGVFVLVAVTLHVLRKRRNGKSRIHLVEGR